ncbi:hypothetical protein LOD99_13875 [Oopsacas minuta]|uniref:Uncharacterized protein n=1 Tax=Oopsacas minuta TaxID=111878 RepID=A0AAV7KGT0_9METZ|nr:hypothetical protein LOD99_13875 [Oopsacas minuta]
MFMKLFQQIQNYQFIISRSFTELSPRGGYTDRFLRHVEGLRHKRRLRTAKYHLQPRNWKGVGQRIRARADYRPDHRPPARPPLDIIDNQSAV